MQFTLKGCNACCSCCISGNIPSSMSVVISGVLSEVASFDSGTCTTQCDIVNGTWVLPLSFTTSDNCPTYLTTTPMTYDCGGGPVAGTLNIQLGIGGLPGVGVGRRLDLFIYFTANLATQIMHRAIKSEEAIYCIDYSSYQLDLVADKSGSPICSSADGIAEITAIP